MVDFVVFTQKLPKETHISPRVNVHYFRFVTFASRKMDIFPENVKCFCIYIRNNCTCDE